VGHMPDTELFPNSKPAPVQRLEVFTGTGRRRSWTAEQKARIVAESHEGDETVCAVARHHGLTPQQLFGWRRKARRRVIVEASESGPAFAPVIVEADRPRLEMPIAPGRPSGSSTIEIVIGAATVRVPPGIDALTLTVVLRAVRAAT
ncbi:MAG: IS66-like element accessory protein TnpA, partial [Acetobacteraceae bacterium]